MPFKKPISIAAFLLGALGGLTLIFFATWADLESTFYGFDNTGGEPLGALSCPIFMTKTETSSFSVKVVNETEKQIFPSVVTNVSTPATMEKNNDPLTLESGAAQTLTWEIGPQNIDLGRFIFVRAWVRGGYPMKDKENTCGVYILPLAGKGIYYSWGLALICLLGLGIGLYGVYQSQSPARRGHGVFTQLLFFTVVIVIGLISVHISFWLLGVLTLVVSILLTLLFAGASVARENG